MDNAFNVFHGHFGVDMRQNILHVHDIERFGVDASKTIQKTLWQAFASPTLVKRILCIRVCVCTMCVRACEGVSNDDTDIFTPKNLFHDARLGRIS